MTGGTLGAGFPTTAGAFNTTHNGNNDAFVTKLNPAGSALSYSTFLGGAQVDLGLGIAVDPGVDAVYVTGDTVNHTTTDFPTTPGAFDETHNSPGTGHDAFVTKLIFSGSTLGYSTFLGGRCNDVGRSIALDPSGAAYLTGESFAGDPHFPTTVGAFDETPNGSSDAFATQLNPAGSALAYSTLLGGASSDIGRGIARDASGAVYLTGNTLAGDYPTTPGAYDTSHNGSLDAFATKLALPALRARNATAIEGDAGEQSAIVEVRLAARARGHGHGRLRDRERLGAGAGRLHEHHRHRSPSTPATPRS